MLVDARPLLRHHLVATSSLVIFDVPHHFCSDLSVGLRTLFHTLPPIPPFPLHFYPDMINMSSYSTPLPLLAYQPE